MKTIIKYILKSDPYYNNYYNYMEQKTQTELIQILYNTLKQGKYTIEQKEQELKEMDKLKDYDKYNLLNQIDNSKAILILNYLIKSKNKQEII